MRCVKALKPRNNDEEVARPACRSRGGRRGAVAACHDGLKDGGHDVLVVASGAEVLALLESAVVKYSALVTDIRLKDGENGWEVAWKAREIEPGLAVVHATSASADNWCAQGVPNSILLEKPFAVAHLLTAVSRLLDTGNGAA